MMSALRLVDEFYPDESMMAKAFDEALARRYSVCDMFYLILARRTGATLFSEKEDRQARRIAIWRRMETRVDIEPLCRLAYLPVLE